MSQCNMHTIYIYNNMYTIILHIFTVGKCILGKHQISQHYSTINPLAAIDAKMRHLHPPQVQALSRAH